MFKLIREIALIIKANYMKKKEWPIVEETRKVIKRYCESLGPDDAEEYETAQKVLHDVSLLEEELSRIIYLSCRAQDERTKSVFLSAQEMNMCHQLSQLKSNYEIKLAWKKL